MIICLKNHPEELWVEKTSKLACNDTLNSHVANSDIGEWFHTKLPWYLGDRLHLPLATWPPTITSTNDLPLATPPPPRQALFGCTSWNSTSFTPSKAGIEICIFSCVWLFDRCTNQPLGIAWQYGNIIRVKSCITKKSCLFSCFFICLVKIITFQSPKIEQHLTKVVSIWWMWNTKILRVPKEGWTFFWGNNSSKASIYLCFKNFTGSKTPSFWTLRRVWGTHASFLCSLLIARRKCVFKHDMIWSLYQEPLKQRLFQGKTSKVTSSTQ